MENKILVEDISKIQLAVHQSYKEHDLLKSILDGLTDIEGFMFWDHQTEFEQLLQSDFIEFALEKEAEAFVNEDFYQLPLYFNSNRAKGWVVMNTPYFRLSTFNFDQKLVQKHREANKDKASSLQVAPQDQLLYFPKGGNTLLDIYEVADVSPDKPAGSRMFLKESIAIQDGQFVKVLAGKQALHFKHVEQDVSYHEISSVQSDLRVIGEYNLDSLQLVGVSAANLSSSRAEMFSEMVANFNHKPSIPVLEKLCSHKDHFVRWSSATALYALDNEAGENMIRKLTDDPHLDVQQTAKHCVSMFESERA